MKKKIVLIDDDADLPSKVKGLIKSWNLDHHYDIVNNFDLTPKENTEDSKFSFCRKIIDLVEENNVDDNIAAILLDVFFDITNDKKGVTLGYEIGRNLRLHFPQTPIILFTVEKNYQEALNAFNFDGYILKGKFNNWTDSTDFIAIITLAKHRRDRVIEECVHLNTRLNVDKIENPIIMHISDIHRGFETVKDDPNLYKSTLKSLVRDVDNYKLGGIPKPNLIVVSGDITCKGSISGYKVAKKFLLELGAKLNISPDRIVLCPGNHDIDRAISRLSYELDPYNKESDKGSIETIPNDHYVFRFSPFKVFFDDFYEGKCLYKLETNKMFSIFDYSLSFGIVIICFNSSEKIDNFEQNQESAYISLEAIEYVREEINRLNLEKYIKLAVWHHPLLDNKSGNQKFHYRFLEELSKLGCILYLHGHMHEPDNRNPPNSSSTMVAQFGAGTIGLTEKPNDIPRHYEILAFDYDEGSYTVYSRQRIGENWTKCSSFSDESDMFTQKMPDELLNKIVIGL